MGQDAETAFELVIIGDELLLGQTADTNSGVIARALAGLGIRTRRITTVGDDLAGIATAFEEALARTGCLIATGGLGPTHDDVTKKAAASLFHRRLVLEKGLLRRVEERFRRAGIPMPVVNRTQAEVPEGARILPNPHGTAPGLVLEEGGRYVILLPGVPHEMEALLQTEVLPLLKARFGGQQVLLMRRLRTFGVPESALAERVREIVDPLTNPRVAFLPSRRGVDLRLTACGADEAEARRVIEAVEGRLRPILGEDLYGVDEQTLAEVVVHRLIERGQTLAVAESCTGGLMGDSLTDVPGSSACFMGSVVAYANRWKELLLHVPPELLEQHGAVSAEAAGAMAQGVRALMSVDYGLAVTGIAGPTGGSPNKPVGLVFFALAWEGGLLTPRRQFQGSRRAIKEMASLAALDLLRRHLSHIAW